MIKIHAIQTGKVKVKQFQITGANSIISRLWQLFFGKNWSDWYPIYCWLVEHPDGPFLIDVGEVAEVHKPGYLPDNFGLKVSVKYEVEREDEVDKKRSRLPWLSCFFGPYHFSFILISSLFQAGNIEPLTI
ncbi:hypothetical protein [Candidatus Scalindua japonica]|nr:hypothetical protein [Candidatus Scalindua japonica]